MRLNSPIGSRESKKKNGKRGGGVALKKSGRWVSPEGLLSEHFPVEETSVSFVFYNGAAGKVFLAGTFNGWEPAGTAMQKGADGIWRTDLVLKPGTYEYRFVVDGVWQEDPISERFAANPFGGLNSVLVVKG
jgi:1,4-alpha-glucan branching enzyme